MIDMLMFNMNLILVRMLCMYKVHNNFFLCTFPFLVEFMHVCAYESAYDD